MKIIYLQMKLTRIIVSTIIYTIFYSFMHVLSCTALRQLLYISTCKGINRRPYIFRRTIIHTVIIIHNVMSCNNIIAYGCTCISAISIVLCCLGAEPSTGEFGDGGPGEEGSVSCDGGDRMSCDGGDSVSCEGSGAVRDGASLVREIDEASASGATAGVGPGAVKHHPVTFNPHGGSVLSLKVSLAYMYMYMCIVRDN